MLTTVVTSSREVSSLTLPPACSLFLSPSRRLLGEIPIPWASISQQFDSQREGQLLRISPCLAGTVTGSSTTNAYLHPSGAQRKLI